MKRIIFYILWMLLPFCISAQEVIGVDFECKDCFTEESWIDELVKEGYWDLSEVEAIAISDGSYNYIEGDQKKITLTLKTQEDGSETFQFELTDLLEQNIGGFISSGEGTARASIHYVTQISCEANMMQLRSRGSPRNAEDYTEDIYIIDFDGDGQDVKLLTKFEFSEAFSNRFANQPPSARHLSPLGKWAKELLWNGFQKVVASVSSGPKSLLKFIGNQNPWAVAFNVIANYSIGGLIEYYSGPDEATYLESLLNHILDSGFRGALGNVVEAFGNGITSSIITSAIGAIIKTPLKDFKAREFFEGIAIGTVLNLIFTSNNVEKLKKLVGKVRIFVKDLVDEPKLIKAFWENRRLVNAWKIPSKHGDALATDVPFLTKLSDDITNPQFPNGSSATAAQLEAALDNQAIFNFYKKFHDSPDLGDLMRQRYLEAATLPDAAARKAILESVLDQKAAIRGLGHLSDDLLENLSRSNLADGTATFTSANGSTVQIDFLSVSGVQPSQTLISEGATVIGGKSVVPKAGSNSTRYFKWTNSQRAQDSEAKIIEYVMDQVAATRGINIPQGSNKADYIDDVLDGANLQIVIKSEMEACSSCADVISSFNNSNAIPIDFSGGTKFYEQYGG